MADVGARVTSPTEPVRPAKSHTILIAFVLPEDKGDWTEVEADDIADGFRDIINEEWERNAASRPGYYTPCEVSAIPAPQWVTTESLRELRSAGEMRAFIERLAYVRRHMTAAEQSAFDAFTGYPHQREAASSGGHA